MNTSLIKAFKKFCVEENITINNFSFSFFRTRPLLLVMFIFYAWEDIFAKSYLSTSVHIDLHGTTPRALYENARKIYYDHECSIVGNEPLNTIIKEMSHESDILRKMKIRRHNETLASRANTIS